MRTEHVLGLLVGPLLLGGAGVQQDRGAALAKLIQELGHPETRVRRKAIRGLERAGPVAVPMLRDVLRSGRSERQLRSAALTLGRLGRPGREALIELLGMERLHETLAFGLRLAGQAAVEPLIARLVDELPSVRRGAACCLGVLGRRAWAAAPLLVDALDDGSPGVRAAAARSLASIQAASEGLVSGLLRLLEDPDDEVRGAAVDALGQVGQGALGELIQKLEQAPATSSDAKRVFGYIQDVEAGQVPRGFIQLFALARLGPAALQRLGGLLASGDETQRWRACLALGTVGRAPDPERIRSGISKLLGSELVESRLAATWALGRVSGEEALDAVAARLEDPVQLVRLTAVLTLGSIGSAAIPVLSRGLEHGLASERSVAAFELGQLARQRDEALEALIENLGNEQEEVRFEIERGLLQIPDRAAPALIEVLEGHKHEAAPRRARLAVQILGQIGARAMPARPVLLDLLENDEALRLPILRLLRETGVKAPEGIATLIRCLGSGDASVRLAVVRVLGETGPPARPATRDLERLLEDPSAELRLMAAWALRRVDPSRSASYTKLVEELRGGRADDRRRATKRLGMLSSPAVVPVLAGALADPDVEVRYWAAWGLRRMGTRAGPATQGLIGVLGDPSVGVRRFAVAALGRIGKPAVPALIRVLRTEEDDRRRLWAAMALERVGPDAASAIGDLEKLKHDTNSAVRSAAAFALLAIRRR